MADKEQKKQAELQFAGQDTEEAKTAVKQQRERKKRTDALRKLEKKLKSLSADSAEYAKILQEVNEAKAAVAALDGAPTAGAPPATLASASPRLPEASPADAAPATGSSPDPKPSAAADEEEVERKRIEKEQKKQSELTFAGQGTEEAKAAVAKQRELKKKKDALRKVQKKIKSLKPEDEAYPAAKEEEAQLEKDICFLEGGSTAGRTAGVAAAPATTTGKAVALVEGALTKHEAVAKVPEVEDVEGNAAKLREMVERAMQASKGFLLNRLRDSVVHPRVAEVTVLMEAMLIVGGNARALAMIAAFREMFRTTTVLSGLSLQDTDTQAVTELVERNFAFMRRKREANAGMRYVKEAVVRRLIAVRDDMVQQKHRDTSVDSDGRGRGRGSAASQSPVAENFTGDAREVAQQILDMVDTEIRMSVKSIVEERSLPYVSSSDTILVFGRSSVVEFILLSRCNQPQRKPKRVIVVDSAPLYEGRELAHKLSEVGIDVTYGLITAACTLVPKCTRVFIGASCVLQDGDVFSRCGTALIAACAKAFRKPVLCFAESYKFVSEVWLGNLAQNTKLVDIKENPAGSHEAACRSPLTYSTPPSFSPKQPQPAPGLGGFGSSDNMWRKGGGEFTPLMPSSGAGIPTPLPTAAIPSTMSSSAASGYLYDLTPAAYVDMILCEMGCLHTSAIIAAIKDREGRDASPAMAFTLKNSL